MESASEAKPKLAGGKRWWVGCLQAWLWSSTWDFRKTIRPRKLPVFCVFRNRKSLILESRIEKILLVESRILGRDPFNQNFRKFRSKTQWIGSVQPEKFRKNRSTFWGGPLFPVGPVWILVEWMVTGLSPILKPREDKFFLVPHLFKSVYLGCFRGDLDKNLSETLWNYGSLEESFFIKKQGRIQDFS